VYNAWRELHFVTLIGNLFNVNTWILSLAIHSEEKVAKVHKLPSAFDTAPKQ